ncbi:MAG: PTS glucitol/sorbitol transporter subunit IIA [Rubrobacteraceae bacterium]
MAQTIYSTEVTEIGPEVPDFLGEGLLILFEKGAPPELAEISVLHAPTSRRDEPPEPGDLVVIGPCEFRITAIGEKAWKNVEDLGHACFKFNGNDEAELPGEICLEQPGDRDLNELITPGVKIEIKSNGERDAS